MKPLHALLIAGALFGPPAAVAATAPLPIQPGYWESTNRLLSPIRTTKVEQRCITPADVEKFMEGPSNRHYACTYPTRSIQGGKMMFKGSCVSKKGRKVAVDGAGAYTPTSFELTANIATEWAGIPLAGRASTSARRIGDTCPPPAAPQAEGTN